MKIYTIQTKTKKMAKRKSQSEHDEIVKKVAEALIESGYKDVKADIDNYDTPAEIVWEKTNKGHIPDVRGKKDKEVIVEVETDDSINDDHTAGQWKLFSAYASQHDAEFMISVPEGSKEKAEKRLTELNISVSVLEVSVD